MNDTISLRNVNRVLAATVIGVTGAVLVGPGLFPSDAGSSPPTTASGSPPPTEGEWRSPLADGRHFGVIGGAYVAPDELTFDRMELLTGMEARRAARAAGWPEDEIGDWFIRDTTPGVVSLAVDRDVVVTEVDCTGAGCVEGSPTDYGSFTGSTEESDGWYWITVENGFVVRIDQQYLP